MVRRAIFCTQTMDAGIKGTHTSSATAAGSDRGRKRHEQRQGGEQGIEKLRQVLAEVALELLGALDAHLHGDARRHGLAVGGPERRELVVDLLANGAFRAGSGLAAHALRRRLAHHAHHDRPRRHRKNADRHSRVSRALERRLQEQADDHEQRDIARKGHPLKRHIGDDELDSARHHRKQTFIEHVFPVFTHTKFESYTWLIVIKRYFLGREGEKIIQAAQNTC